MPIAAESQTAAFATPVTSVQRSSKSGMARENELRFGAINA
jgi:hypothetical protein